jgi:hypothetical protein
MDAESGLPVASAKPEAAPPKAPPGAPLPERPAPAESFPGSLLLVGGLSVLCLFVFLFAEEIKSVFGVGPAVTETGAEPGSGERVAPPEDAAPLADRLAQEVAAWKAELRALAPLPDRVRGMEQSLGAVRADLDRRLTTLEARQEGTLAEVRKLRADLRIVIAGLARAAGAPDPEKSEPAAEPEEILTPREKLFREVMEALESNDEKKDR